MTDDFMPPGFSEHFETEAPEVLYHYTGQAGLLGIVQRTELWCTKVQYMNDSTEFGLALNLARQRLDVMIKSATGTETAPPNSPPNNLRILQICTGLRRSLDGLEEINIFAACFCENGDLLSQWRGYASGGHGYAIEFDVAMLQRAAKEKHFTFGKCIYDVDVQREIIDQAIQKCIDDDLAIPQRTDWQMHGPLAKILFQCGAFFKEVSFKEEQEWRLVSPTIVFRDEQLAFRPGKSMITPYYKLPIVSERHLPIRSVVVGPCPHMRLSRWSVKAMLMKYGVTGPYVGYDTTVPSEIPFRDW